MVKYICEIILILCVFFSFHQQSIDNNCEKIVLADGLGYYSYLPAIFIYNDYEFSFTKSISEKHEKMNFGDGFLKETDSGKVNKYYFGLSILLLPFFLVAHFLAILLGLPADGYSQIYQISVLLAANFYVWLGCKYLRKLILSYSVSENAAAFILLLTVFGTNLFFYTTFYSSYTHAYSFALISIFLFSVHSFFLKENVKYLYFSALLLGIIALLRPTNLVIIILFPFLAGSLQRFWEKIKKFARYIPIAFTIFLLAIFPQFLLYYVQTGHFMVWSYGDEKFYFDNPEFLNVLFSYKKGLFVYTPLCLVALVGLFPLFKNNKFQFTIMVLFLFLSTYIISSWWCWYYGGSLGQRVFIDYYAILGLLFSFLYLGLKKNYHKWLFFLITLPLVYYSLILSYQYRYRMIDYSGMNKQKFWFIFLRTEKSLEGLTSSGAFSNTGSTNIINIKASNNKYLSSERNESNYILANRNEASGWEVFNMILLDNNNIAIKSDDGKYVSARLDNGAVLAHVADEIKPWEIFEKVQFDKDSFMLKACNGKFVALSGDTLYANAENISHAEHFTIIYK